MKRVLVANIFGIGDVLFTTPLISSLKKEIEGVRVDYLCNARAKPALECDPDVDRIIVYEKDDLTELWKSSRVKCLKAVLGLFSDVRKGKYDAVFDFTLSRKFGLFFALAGIRRRIGLNYRNRGIFLTDKVEFSGFRNRHVTEYYLDLLGKAGIKASVKEMQLVPDDNLREWARTYLNDRGADKGPVAMIIPGGGASWGLNAVRKRWEAEGFLRVADNLAAQGVKIGILGDRSEEVLCKTISDKMSTKPVIVENNLDLKRYIAVLSACDLALCNDGGPLHIAVSLGVKTVSVFGPVDEKVYGPYPPSGNNRVMTAAELPCRPCYDRFKLPECGNNMRCLTGIDAEEVTRACLELLGSRAVQR
jgi:ADP-heptose:LPS heptosyltransferase